MKTLMATILLLVLHAVALAKPTPDAHLQSDLSINMSAVGVMQENIGSVGAMRERDYFVAPQEPLNQDAFPCRLKPVLFNKKRLAQSCR